MCHYFQREKNGFPPTGLNTEPAQAYSVVHTSPVYDADTAVHTQTNSQSQSHTAALPADIGLPKPCNAMPDTDPVTLSGPWLHSQAKGSLTA